MVRYSREDRCTSAQILNQSTWEVRLPTLPFEMSLLVEYLMQLLTPLANLPDFAERPVNRYCSVMAADLPKPQHRVYSEVPSVP